MDIQDREFIKTNSENYTINEMVEYFNGKYTKKQIKNFMTNNNLTYKHLSKSQRSVILSQNNRNRTYDRTKYNKDYFKHWSKNMAYVFGLWCADGNICMTSGGYYFSITLKQSDKYLLENILQDMNSEHKIYEKSDGSCKICFSSKDFYNDLLTLGGKEKKSLVLEFPNIPEEYINHFIRGYFDGDGSINKNHTGYLIGTYEFCNSIKEILQSQGIEISSIRQKHPENGLDNNCYCLNIFRQSEFSKFENYMYQNVDEGTLYLKRKDVRQYYLNC